MWGPGQLWELGQVQVLLEVEGVLVEELPLQRRNHLMEDLLL